MVQCWVIMMIVLWRPKTGGQNLILWEQQNTNLAGIFWLPVKTNLAGLVKWCTDSFTLLFLSNRHLPKIGACLAPAHILYQPTFVDGHMDRGREGGTERQRDKETERRRDG